ncbi:MAG: aminotransferase class V-fold PLP-dependent enzyme [Candidatus Glassbacteria bacterium]
MSLFTTDELHELRSLFPHAEKSIYLDHAAVSPLSIPVVESMKAYLKERSEGSINDFEGNVALIGETKRLLARLIGAEGREIALTKNTSEGLNIIAQGISWRGGDRVLLNDREFPSNIYPFTNLRSRGVEVDFARCSDGRIELDALKEKLVPRTRLISISHVSFVSGFRVDLEEISKLCDEHSVYLCVDAIQSVGVIPLNVSRWGIDLLSCGGHKWLMSPLGTGFLYIRDGLWDEIKPAFMSWLSVSEPFDFFNYDQSLAVDASRYEYATPNMVGIAGMKAAVGLFLDVGVRRIEEHVLSLLNFLADRLSDMGLEIMNTFKRKESSGILLFRVQDAGSLSRELAGEGITVSVREGAVRVSPHFYNSPDEIETFTATMKRLLSKRR